MASDSNEPVGGIEINFQAKDSLAPAVVTFGDLSDAQVAQASASLAAFAQMRIHGRLLDQLAEISAEQARMAQLIMPGGTGRWRLVRDQ